MPSSKTKPGTPKLSEVARKVVAPSGIVSTGWPAVAATCTDKLGLSFDLWQNQAGRLALAKRADGKLAATIGGVGMSICRQAGKTHWMTGLTFGVSVNRPNTLSVWSAHHARTHGETFLAMRAFAERQRVAPYIEQIFTGSGDEEIRFRNGSRILFGARERGFGRGIPGVDMIIADEAQIMSENAVDAMTATMNTSDFGLAFYIGTPPKPTDPSEAFTRMRTEAWAGTLEDSVWIEFGADPGSDPASPETWRIANPSFPHRTPVESMLRLRKKLSADSFNREGLGIWDEDTGGGAISRRAWGAKRDPDSTPVDPVSFGIYVNLDRSEAAIGVAGRRTDGKFHVGIVPAVRGQNIAMLPGTAWIPDRMKELVDSWEPSAVVIPGNSSATSLIPDLEDLGIDVTTMTGADMARVCGAIDDAVTKDDNLRHRGCKPLNDAVAAARWRTLQDQRVWDWKTGGITQLVAISAAMHGVRSEVEQETEVWGFFE